jgi:hypothetical protein
VSEWVPLVAPYAIAALLIASIFTPRGARPWLGRFVFAPLRPLFMIASAAYFAAERNWWLAAIMAVLGIVLAMWVDIPTMVGTRLGRRGIEGKGLG